MTLYHGTKTKDLIVESHVRSRYGFAAFFASPNKHLAIQYAYYNYIKHGSGFLYRFNLDTQYHEVDFKNRVSHSLVFRNMVLQLQKAQHDVVLIKNVIDYPSERVATYTPSDIVIIFNLELIGNLKLSGKY